MQSFFDLFTRPKPRDIENVGSVNGMLMSEGANSAPTSEESSPTDVKEVWFSGCHSGALDRDISLRLTVFLLFPL